MEPIDSNRSSQEGITPVASVPLDTVSGGNRSLLRDSYIPRMSSVSQYTPNPRQRFAEPTTSEEICPTPLSSAPAQDTENLPAKLIINPSAPMVSAELKIDAERTPLNSQAATVLPNVDLLR